MHASRRVLALVVSLAGVALGGCSAGSKQGAHAESPAAAVLFEGMGTHHRAVTTKSAEAQRWFDQGLTWMFAFNHDEAIRSFEKCAELDPGCAMAWWGVAICCGPHINLPMMDAARDAKAWSALEKARALRGGASAVERDLIDALGARYAQDAPADRAHLDAAYAEAMRGVWKKHPQDADVAALCAESVMDLHPWNLWTHEGKPKEGAEEVVATLEAALRLDVDHPGACHLYIHAVEASDRPERALASADRLRTMVPASGHLTHMPSHIDVRVGQWEQASVANERAMAVDAGYRALSPRQGFYNVYMLHNAHFLAFSSMMEGRKESALAAARKTEADVPADFLEQTPVFADPFMNITLSAQMRFGMWEEILKEKAPAKSLAFSRAMWRFTRAVALANLDRHADAERERRRFAQAVRTVPEDQVLMINKAHAVLGVAESVLDGEIAYRKGDIETALEHLREGVRREDALMYMEPPEWIQPVRHTLGAVLVEAGQFDEAEAVYRADLVKWPGNGWALFGLAQALEGQGRASEAMAAREKFERAWKRADIKLNSTCLCVAAAECCRESDGAAAAQPVGAHAGGE